MATRLLNIDEISKNYELFIFDLWGVIHNGEAPFSNTLKCLARLKKENKLSFLLSNSPRLTHQTIDHLSTMGIAKDLYEGAYTSGTDCHLNLKNRDTPFYESLGKNLYHLGPETYTSIFNTLDYNAISDVNQADFLLVSGTVNWIESEDKYDFLLKKTLSRNLPAVCANADKQVICGQKRLLCAGMLAKRYLQMGGNISLHGKPSPIMYQKVHQLAEKFANQVIDKKKILMIGDSLATDIKGANTYNIDSLMVLTGVHGEDLLPLWPNPDSFENKLSVLEKTYQSQPTYIISGLK